jgi:hypothetical protein
VEVKCQTSNQHTEFLLSEDKLKNSAAMLFTSRSNLEVKYGMNLEAIWNQNLEAI